MIQYFIPDINPNSDINSIIIDGIYVDITYVDNIKKVYSNKSDKNFSAELVKVIKNNPDKIDEFIIDGYDKQLISHYRCYNLPDCLFQDE